MTDNELVRAVLTILNGRIVIFRTAREGTVLGEMSAAAMLTDGHSKTLTECIARAPHLMLTAPVRVNLKMPDGKTVAGIAPRAFVSLLRAYSRALREGTLHQHQLKTGRRAVELLEELAEAGLVEACNKAFEPREHD